MKILFVLVASAIVFASCEKDDFNEVTVLEPADVYYSDVQHLDNDSIYLKPSY